MAQDKEDVSSKKVTPPMPDSPITDPSIVTKLEKENVRPEVDEATRKMADEIKSGRSPYDFRGEIQEKKSFFANFPVAGVVFVTLVLFLAITSFFGYQKYTDISGQFEDMAVEISTMSEQLRVLRDSNDWTSKSVIRAELQKTLVALERVIALGEVEVTKKALNLREEINAILVELGKGGIEDEVFVAPGADSGSSDTMLEKDPIQAVFGKSDQG